MPTYVALVNWTDHGIKNFRDTVRRAEDYRIWSRRTAARFASCCGPVWPTRPSPRDAEANRDDVIGHRHSRSRGGVGVS